MFKQLTPKKFKMLVAAATGAALLGVLPANAAVKSPAARVTVVPIEQIVAAVQAERRDRLAGHIGEQYGVSPARAARIIAEAERAAARHAIDPALILAVIAVESTFRERVVSSMGARGLMQIMARYHPHKVRRVGGSQALFDPAKNIAVGSQILVDYLALSDGDLRKALLRYNGSLDNPRSRYADKVLGIYRQLQQAGMVG